MIQTLELNANQNSNTNGMTESIIIIARNEGDWPRITALNFQHQFPGSEIIGIDDGGQNNWPEKVKVIKTTGGIGVGMSRRLGVENASHDLVCISDGHVLFDRGDKQKAWQTAAAGNVVTFTTKSITSGREHGNGRKHFLPDHSTKNCTVPEGAQIGMIGGVYFMKKDVALDIIAPTNSHGFNEQIMTVAALAFGHPIYSMGSLVFQHLYKNSFNYNVTYSGQTRNRNLLDWWFFSKAKPANVTGDEQKYYDLVQMKRKLSGNEIAKIITSW